MKSVAIVHFTSISVIMTDIPSSSSCLMQMDLKDPRFDAMFTSHLYNLDPSEPGYKKTKATQSFLDEKQRRREEKQQKQEQEMTKKKQEVADESVPTTSSSTSKRKEADPNLSLLIKNIKNKTEQFQARKKQKM